MYTKYQLIIPAIVFGSLAYSQNLVPNGSFEDHTVCPNAQSPTEINKAQNWMNPSTFGSPDYYHECGSGGYAVPKMWAGYQNAKSGVAYAGVFAYVPGAETREYVEVPLASPLVANKEYKFKMYVNLINGARQAVDAFGVYFSTAAISGVASIDPLPYVPQIKNAPGNILKDTLGWTLIGGTYTAAGGETHLIIGNFEYNAGMQISVVNPSGAFDYAYYLVDDVSLIDKSAECPICDSLGDELASNGDFSVGNVGFSSDYIYQSSNSTMLPTEYVINTEASAYHWAWEGKDHTTGNGNYFFGSGLSSGPNIAWSQTITVTPNINYVFSAWVNNILSLSSFGDYADPVLELIVNGAIVAGPVTLPEIPDEWERLCGKWNSGSNTSAVIEVKSLDVTATGNDFGIDDLSFKEILAEHPQVTASISPDAAVCKGSNTVLSASGGTLFSWSPPIGLSNASVSNPKADPLVTTTYSVIVSDGYCPDTVNVTVTVNPLPTPVISGDTVICVNDATLLKASGGTKYLWNTGETTTSIIPNSISSSTYSVIVYNEFCQKSKSVSFIVNPLPIVSASQDTTIDLNSSTVLFATGGISYTWSPSAGLSCISCPSPTASPAITTSFVVKGTDSNGCTDMDTVVVTLNTGCFTAFVPNSFSPNGDELNDILYVYGNCIKTLQFTIYDRWGKMIFESTDINKGWHGDYKNEIVKEDVFVFYLKAISINDEIIEQRSRITVVR